MSVGQGALISPLSYVAVAREVTYGTYVTGTSGLNFLSCSMKTLKETKIIEEIVTERTYRNSIQTGRVVEGEIEFNFSPINAASNYLLHNAMGAGVSQITSATATGETIGGGAFTHTINIGNFDNTYSSLSMNIRKGDSAGAKIFQYQGIRVNEITFAAEIDEPLKCTVGLVAQDSSLTTNDVSASLNTLTQRPLSFVNGRFSVETATGSLTTTSFWHVQSFELKLNNALKSDSAARRIGADTIQVLPPGPATFELSCSVRFDTSTAYSAMLNGTRLACELEFRGDTMSGSALQEGIKITLPYVLISDAGDPEIGGPDEILQSEVVFKVLRDPTSGGYAMRAAVTNNTASYA